MVELYLHSPICLHVIVLNYLSTGTAIPSAILPSLNKKVELHSGMVHTRSNDTLCDFENLFGPQSFEILIAMAMKSTVFWNVMPCSLVEVYLRFGGTEQATFILPFLAFCSNYTPSFPFFFISISSSSSLLFFLYISFFF
jgi:hypothetical protein